MKTYSHVAAALYGRPWYIVPEQLAALAEIVARHGAGDLGRDEIGARLAAAAATNGPRRGARTEGAIAVIPIYGPIFPRANLITEMSGGTTVASLRAAFRDALADESVGSILLDIDSPGGAVDGIEELATEIRASRGRKPIVAIADYLMASAAYYLASGADEVVASPSAQVGWIGCAMIHQETSRHDDAEGVTTTILRDPPGKMGANSLEPLGESARADLQAYVDEMSAMFHAAVAAGRGVPVSKVKADFGQGGGMSATRARAAGLVDRVATFDETVGRLARASARTSGAVRGTTSAAASAALAVARARLDALDDPSRSRSPVAAPRPRIASSPQHRRIAP